jgi:hypothetical protein
MEALKVALDPLGILNPGKMTDAASATSATGAALPHTDPEAAQRSTAPG